MKITLFGASGNIGYLLLKQAINEGHHVIAYVRNPSKLALSHNNLQIIKGNLDDKNNIRKAVEGADVVISVLGPPLQRNYEGMPLLDGHRNILTSMTEVGVKHFITLATPSVKFEKDVMSFATIFPGIMARLIFPKPYKEIVAIGNLIRMTDLDWAIVRIIAPNDKPAKGKVNVTFGDKKFNMAISREDIAAFILKEAKQRNYIKSMPIIGS